MVCVLALYLIREYLCWPDTEFCSRKNGTCLRENVVIMGVIPTFLSILVLSGLLIDDWYGWASLVTRLQQAFRCQQEEDNGDIEIQDMSSNQNNNNEQTVSLRLSFNFSFVNLCNFYKVHVKALAMLVALLVFAVICVFTAMTNYFGLLEGESLFLKFVAAVFGCAMVPTIWVLNNNTMKNKVKHVLCFKCCK